MSNDYVETLIQRLRDLTIAYDESMFPPLSPEETKANSGIVTRASAGMGRHFGKVFTEAANELERLQVSHERYEMVRQFAPVHYKRLWDRCLTGEVTFDQAVDQERESGHWY